jgi:hypothetical protein
MNRMNHALYPLSQARRHELQLALDLRDHRRRREERDDEYGRRLALGHAREESEERLDVPCASRRVSIICAFARRGRGAPHELGTSPTMFAMVMTTREVMECTVGGLMLDKSRREG